jgi:hypothetical protein
MGEIERSISVAGCAACPYRNIDRATYKDWLCGHPDMTRKFSVSAFTLRGEFPKRCPLKEEA